MKKLIPLLLAVILILPACTTQEGGENMANYLYNGVELPDINTVWTDELKATHPYAYIAVGDASSIGGAGAIIANLFLYSTAPIAKPSGTTAGLMVLSETEYKTSRFTNNQTVKTTYESIGYDVGLNEWCVVSESDGTLVSANANGWADFDILNEDGTLFLAASEPVPVSKLTITAGGSANGDGMALYNGVMLPKLPEWDKAAYPYAYVSCTDGSVVGEQYTGCVAAIANFNSAKPIAADEDGEFYYSGTHAYAEYVFASGGLAEILGIPAGEWVLSSSMDDQNGGSVDGSMIVWTNFDILNEDGSTHLSASADPTPLDGMNVITWDGDTTGLPSLSIWYLLGEYENASDGVAVFLEGGNRLVGTLFEKTDSGWTISYGTDTSSSQMIAQAISGAGIGGAYFAEDGYTTLIAYKSPSSGGVTDTTATVNFSCKDLLYTDSVYRIKAWVYKVADGLDTTLPATYTSEATFAGPTHSESHTFEGLTPATDYAVYGVIWLETDGAASEHNATATFTTLAGEAGPDYSDASLDVSYEELTTNSAYLEVDFSGIPQGEELSTYLDCTLDDGKEARENPLLVDNPPSDNVDGVLEVYFDGLEPNTEYTATFRLVYQMFGESGYTDTGKGVSYTFTTLPDTAPNSFPMGFASGLSGMPVTTANADHNRWMQGYIVGEAFRRML